MITRSGITRSGSGRGALIALVVGVAAGLGLGCLEDSPSSDPETRRPAPEFDLPLLSGADVQLSKLRGKTVIVDFWATWCTPCEVQMPVLDALWKEQKGDGLMVVGVSVDTAPASEVESWIEERELGYPIALGDMQLAREYGAVGFPTLVVIDPNGGIHTRHLGVLSRPELEDILESIRLESLPPS